MKSFVMLFLVVSLVHAGRFTAAEDGAGNCWLQCMMGTCITQNAVQCAMCLASCALHVESAPMELLDRLDNRFYCKLGCSTSVCTKFTDDKFIDNKHRGDETKVKVRGCVNACSQKCTNTMN